MRVKTGSTMFLFDLVNNPTVGAYFLLNDQDKAHFYHSIVWIISCHYPISSSFVRTMRPAVVSLRNCKERIYWLLQFLHSLMKSNWNYIVHKDQNIHYIKFQHEYLLCVNLKNYKSLTLYQVPFSIRLEKFPSLLSSSLSSSQITTPGMLFIYLIYSLE